MIANNTEYVHMLAHIYFVSQSYNFDNPKLQLKKKTEALFIAKILSHLNKCKHLNLFYVLKALQLSSEVKSRMAPTFTLPSFRKGDKRTKGQNIPKETDASEAFNIEEFKVTGG